MNNDTFESCSPEKARLYCVAALTAKAIEELHLPPETKSQCFNAKYLEHMFNHFHNRSEALFLLTRNGEVVGTYFENALNLYL